jgi:hypothetical protein
MKSITITAACLALIFSLIAGGCARPPTEEMNAAVEAVTRAENDADAALYAGNTLARARDALDRMKNEAESKRYDAAKNYAAEAITAAEKAIADGQAGAARVREEAASPDGAQAREEAAALIGELGPAIAETERRIDAAQTANLPLDFGGIAQDFDAACRNAELAEEALVENKYQDALEKGRTARTGLRNIDQQLSSAALSTSRKK